MVVTASVSGTGAVKRPSSSLQDDYTGWETAPSMGVSMRTSTNIPYAHYALIYMDNMGKLKVSESSSIREQNGTVFTSDVRDKFLEILGSKVGYEKPMMRSYSGFAAPVYAYGRADAMTRHPKRRKASVQDPILDMHPSVPVEDYSYSSTTDRIGLEIGNTEKLLEYYENALKHLQQSNCRQLSKVLIKFIEPRKQVKHPYNGGKPRNPATGEKGDPEKTKPDWWPRDVQHKEPDHLRKDQRVRLLIHIFRKTARFGATAEKLLEVARDSKRQLKEPHKMEILEEIFKVRQWEERYEEGGIDASTIVYVQNRDANPKGEKDSDVISEPEQKVEPEEADDFEEEFLTPSSSAEQTSASFTSSIDMSMPGHNRPMHYPLAESLSFTEQPRHERSYYPGSSEYPDEYASHSFIKAPMTPAMVSPNEQANPFDYMTQAPFPASTTGQQMVSQRQAAMPMQHSVSQFDTWTPSYRQNVFSPMEYGAAANQTMPQSHMAYQIPMTSASHLQDLPHGLPDMRSDRLSHLEPMSHKEHSFRTGSLSHPHMMTSHHTTSG